MFSWLLICAPFNDGIFVFHFVVTFSEKNFPLSKRYYNSNLQPFILFSSIIQKQFWCLNYGFYFKKLFSGQLFSFSVIWSASFFIFTCGHQNYFKTFSLVFQSSVFRSHLYLHLFESFRSLEEWGYFLLGEISDKALK